MILGQYKSVLFGIFVWFGAGTLSIFAQSSPTPPPTPAPTFSQIILFGDSLSDTGNVRDRTESKSGGVVDYPSHTFNYDNGRFTNDDQTDPASHTYFGVWHEQLARTFLGITPPTFSLGGGLNYAFGGATTMDGTHTETVVSPPVFGDVTITIDDMGKQMDDYLSGHVVDPNALYIVWGGSNDLRNDPTFASVTATSARAAALVSRLAHAGAQFIMVPNVAPIGDVPRYADSPDSIVDHNRAAAQYRGQLRADLATLQSDLAGQGITPTIYQPDVWTGTVHIFSDGTRYGFTNITTSAQDNSSANPDQFIFWDDKHPTTAAHYRLAKGAYDSITIAPEPVAKPSNIATRVFVDTGERISIAGFIVTGDVPKKVLIRGIGPSLTGNGVPNVLANPTLALFDQNNTALQSNDDWKTSPDATAIMNTGIAPKDDRESAIIATLAPGLYTAQLAGKDNTIGNGVVEVYDLEPNAAAELANLSTRGYVGAGDNVMIGGVIIGSGDSAIMVFRAMGPSLANAGISQPLQDPTIALHDENGTMIAFNDDWKLPQIQAVQAVNLQPPDERESVLVSPFLLSGSYTIIVRGKNDTTGVALVEAYRIP